MTSIGWTHCPDGNGGRKKGETVNPQVGCSETSPGCRNCYAARVAARGMTAHHRGLTVLRSNGPHWNGELARAPDQLEKPLRWRAPRGIFWGSMTDLFHESAMATEDGRRYIAACFGVMAATPQHTHMVLTKRPHLMREWFEWLATEFDDTIDLCVAEAEELCGAAYDRATTDKRGRFTIQRPTWPLPNVWIGTTTEDQQRADERIPELLRVPAAVRFLSAEPLLGPVDLSRWIAPVDRCNDCEAERAGIGEDHCGECGYDGTIITTWGCAQLERLRSGERYANGGPFKDDDGPAIHWIIAGGESGNGARPMHPDWARSLRDQCVAAGIPYFFKQWGAWATVDSEAANDVPGRPGALRWTHMVSRVTGRAYACGEEMPISEVATMAFVRKVGKGKAGRELDGRTWDEFPEVSR